MPNPLPPPITYTGDLVAALSDADRALGGVTTIASFVPNWRLLMAPFLSVEAVMSSRIEGTQATTADLLAAVGEREEALSADTREVRNYLKAMSLGLRRLEELPLSLRLVRELHEVLLWDARGARRSPGQFRAHQVCIGPEGRGVEGSSYIPPPVPHVGPLMDNWEEFLHEETAMPPLVQCAVMHAQFEMIHPFGDGNGRIGRLLMSLSLIAKGHLTHPMLFLSPFLEHHRSEYYGRLLGVSQRGDWAGWVTFFLRAVEVQSRQAVSVAQSILALRRDVRENLVNRRATTAARDLLDRLLSAPFIRMNDAMQELGVSRPTARKAIRELEDVGFLVEVVASGRGKRYGAVPLLEILRRAEQPLSEAEAVQPRLDLE